MDNRDYPGHRLHRSHRIVFVKTSAAIAYEELTRPRPTLDEVPPSPAALTTAWLTAALCSSTPGARAEGFTVGPKNDGTSARRTLR